MLWCLVTLSMFLVKNINVPVSQFVFNFTLPNIWLRFLQCLGYIRPLGIAVFIP